MLRLCQPFLLQFLPSKIVSESYLFLAQGEMKSPEQRNVDLFQKSTQSSVKDAEERSPLNSFDERSNPSRKQTPAPRSHSRTSSAQPNRRKMRATPDQKSSQRATPDMKSPVRGKASPNVHRFSPKVQFEEGQVEIGKTVDLYLISIDNEDLKRKSLQKSRNFGSVTSEATTENVGEIKKSMDKKLLSGQTSPERESFVQEKPLRGSIEHKRGLSGTRSSAQIGMASLNQSREMDKGLLDEIEKWKKFGKMMADSYEELNKKFANYVRESEKDKKVIVALKDQVLNAISPHPIG
jgi:hypothetical protein